MECSALRRRQPGAAVSAVLDVACGTGRSFPLIEARIGHSGRIVGVHITPAMMNKGRARVDRYSWGNVQLIEADAAQVCLERLQAAGAIQPGQRFDAAICTVGLSVIPDWHRAIEAMLSVVRPGGRIAVMDGGYPERAFTWPRAGRHGSRARSIGLSAG